MLICVTHRKLCKDNFLHRIKLLTEGKPHAIMLREKDMNLFEYESLAISVNEICEMNQVRLIINNNITIAEKLNLSNIHLSMPNLREYKNELSSFSQIGASVHSTNEAIEAQELGASYLIAGHIFLTDSKKGVPARGLSFLEDVCASVSIPVFAIGGITKERLTEVGNAGANGVCIMSEAMTCKEPEKLAKHYKI